MDFLEKKIREQRGELDEVERVEEGFLWQNIQADLGQNLSDEKIARKNRGRRFLQIYAIAASVLLLIMASWIFSNKNNSRGSQEAQTPVAHGSQQFVPQFEEEENYRQMVTEKMQTLDFESINRADYKDIFYELDLLEQVHSEFEADYPKMVNKEKAIDVLQKYYNRKIRILERLSKEIEKKSHYEKRINERPM